MTATKIFEDLNIHQSFGLIIRFILIIYGDFHDKHNAVHYTDVDYHVVTDAANYVAEGQSPFLRHTYRYTPFLSWLMLPNIFCHIFSGKIIFSLIDMVATFLIYKILQLQKCSNKLSVICSLLWLYNPIVIGISTRGSPESLVVTFVLCTIYFHIQGMAVASGMFLGIATHFKIYPIIYSLPLYLALENWKRFSLSVFYPTRTRIKFILSAIVTFLALTATAFVLYGDPYIQEAFLYHVTRVDTRHNFSIYFYLLYITVDYTIPGLGIAAFLPQCILVCSYGIAYGNKRDLILSLFAQTLTFVTFNKVITSQYFVWYLVFIPLLYPRLEISTFKCILLPTLWIFAQGAWLLPAYMFEFHGVNVFIPIWLESVAFFCCNVGILMAIISSYWANEAYYVHQKNE